MPHQLTNNKRQNERILFPGADFPNSIKINISWMSPKWDVPLPLEELHLNS